MAETREKAASEQKTVKSSATKKERTVNGFPVSEVITRIQTVYDNGRGTKMPPNQAMTNILGFNWSYDYDVETGYGMLSVFSDEGEELVRRRFPASTYKFALMGAFCSTFGFQIPDFETKGDEASTEVTEEGMELEREPIVEEPVVVQSIPSGAVEAPKVAVRANLQDGNHGRNGHYPTPDHDIPDLFTGKVTLLSRFEPLPKHGTPTGYGAKCDCSGSKLYVRYWLNNSDVQIDGNWLCGLEKGTVLTARFQKSVNSSTGEVQLILRGWSA